MPRADDRTRSRDYSSSPEPRDRHRDRTREREDRARMRDRDRNRDEDDDRDRDVDREYYERREQRQRREDRERRREDRERRERRRSTADNERRRSRPDPDEDRQRSRRQSTPSPEKKTKYRARVTERYVDNSANSSSNALSFDALAKLDAINNGSLDTDDSRAHESDRERRRRRDHDRNRDRDRDRDGDGDRDRNRNKDRDRDRDRDRQRYREKVRESEKIREREIDEPRTRQPRNRSRHHEAAAAIIEQRRRKKRIISTEIEKGGNSATSDSLQEPQTKRFEFVAFKEKVKQKKWWVIGGFVIVVLVVVVAVAVTQSKKNQGVSGSSSSKGSSGSSAPTPGSRPDNIGGMTANDVPAWAKGTYYDPFTWYDVVDFNTTVTNETVGGLPVMGLNSTWDDSVAPNSDIPAISDKFDYGKTPIRGVNVGGWLAIEPFITPSLFDQFPASANIVDEYTLTAKLGSTLAAQQLEKHYSSFINLQEFQQIRNAGFDHVRIPYSYWAITTYDGDPYVKQISWRYLLRGIEYARQCGLRVNLDLHALPGSQNGWNHSGRQGQIGWLNGTDGDANADRSVKLHDQLSQFFAQERYKNVVTIYGLCNEPRMINLPVDKVINWTTTVTQLVQKNGIGQMIAFGDGFLGLDKWKAQFGNLKNMVLDAHQYIIFNTEQIAFDHKTKLNFACSGWSGQMQQSVSKATGFGPTICGEWSQADTDCATYLNNVNVGSRWEGTMNVGDASRNVLSPSCPLKTSQCSCSNANADYTKYSPSYKAWLYNNAVASMISFEKGWGWFYWTWKTEKSVQWSYKLAIGAGIAPKDVRDRSGNGPDGKPVISCSGDAPNYAPTLPENY